MAQQDAAKAIKDALATHYADAEPDWTVTLHVADDYTPVDGSPTLLVADDGGVAVNGGAWLAGRDLLRISIRLTVFAAGRSEARAVIDDVVDHLLANRPAGIARIENVPAVLDTRDRATGASLASITMPVVVKPQ